LTSWLLRVAGQGLIKILALAVQADTEQAQELPAVEQVLNLLYP